MDSSSSRKERKVIDRGTLWLETLKDLGLRCSVDTTLDAEYVQGRIAAEGEEFLTTTLPQFGKDLELALEDRAIAAHLFEGFKRRKRPLVVTDRIDSVDGSYEETTRRSLNHGMPQFLQHFMEKIFDDSYDVTSRELHSYDLAMIRVNSARAKAQAFHGGMFYASLGEFMVPFARPRSEVAEENLQIADAIAAIRQLCLMFAKEKSLCSQASTDAAVAAYVTTDKELIDPFSTEG